MEVNVLDVGAALYRTAVVVEGRSLEGNGSLRVGRKRARGGHRDRRGLHVELDRAVDDGAVVDAVERPELEHVVALLPVAHVDLVVPRAERPVGLGDLSLGHAAGVHGESRGAPFAGEGVPDLDLVDISSLVPLGQLVRGVDACQLPVVSASR